MGQDAFLARETVGDARDIAEPIQYIVAHSPVGLVLVARSDRGVCALSLGEDAEALRADLRTAFPRATLREATKELECLRERVCSLVEEPSREFEETLDLRGTDFQQRVWSALREIPDGRRVSYGDLARKLGVSSGVRAIAGACAANRVAVAVPCHRVVRSNGALAGYRWGIERKRWLLEREARS